MTAKIRPGVAVRSFYLPLQQVVTAYSEDSMVVEYDADHFELLDQQRLKKYIDPILQDTPPAFTKPGGKRDS